ncbi:MAG: DevR family CRISPR-associated autoregulator [Chloroflexi bacterium]|nr:DevR family CRISPR-associated autoregulator [Chloroflexota bacterium]
MTDQTVDVQTLEQVVAARAGRPLTGVAVAARVELAAHALNNEGSRNNATVPRQVDVVAGDEIVQVNAISGDTLKHAFVDYLRASIADRPADAAALPLCDPCRQSDPNRLNADAELQALAKQKADKVSNADVVTALVRRCTIDDVAGLLVTASEKGQPGRNAPRRSTVQFAWQLGIPAQVRTGRYTHVKLVPGDPTGDGGEGSNLGQNIFTKPASSGRYAFVASCDLARIGRNDISTERVIDEATWQARAAAVLTALFHTIALPGGAGRNTQLPHVHGVQGAVAVSVAALPPIVYSPLADDFVTQMGRVAAAFDRGGSEHFVLPFADLGELGHLLTGLAALVRAG